ncbi:gamma-tubulin complex component [Grosmannia clavigera kw1407]|uniref:Spindle pole body component n=1 Tax=Grosmannia clavigera (strain kw1407 / UAMH 11150) TaxID=655863 RepID=F0XLK0_GROCL|nr:gamma-tubulin complex component [Grosmannia clavigera kw1407]EFX01287.1 gamma-tubulin complex component [Grosmannia clavigera kw1407]
MAYFAQLSADAEELVAAVTSISQEDDPDQFRVLHETTLRSLRYHNFPPTNQFEVKHNLDGLEEKFAVIGRDGLADALYERRSTLAEHETNWTADILDFLLALSDNPAEKASLDELNRLCASRCVPKTPPLRWEDISREDGWVDEMELWKKTVFASDDDDDDDDDGGHYDSERDEADVHSGNTTPSNVELLEGQQPRTARDLEVVDARSKEQLDALLQAVRESQAWRTQQRQPPSEDSDGRVLISELQLVRETLFMLRGVDTTLFGGQCVPASSYRLSDVSAEAYDALVDAATTSGRRLLPLRRWTAGGRRPETVPLLQVFQEAIRRRLDAFDRELSAVQARYVDLAQDVIVSLPAVLEQLRPWLANLAALGAVVQQLEAERNPRAFRYLELLHDATAMAQLDGRPELYAFLATVFFECFQLYLRPIRLWMEDGQLLPGDKIFFVAGAAAQAAPNQIWQHQYKLLHTSSGVLHAPRFLQPAAAAIFAAGRSIVVLRQLGQYDSSRRQQALSTAIEPTLDQTTVCAAAGSDLEPFPQLFADAFERWIESKHHAASATLKCTLFDSCGLWSTLETLQCVFLMSDGAMADAFATRLFYSLDSRSPRWNDRYTLTELAREAFGPRLDAYRLSAAVDKAPTTDADRPVMARRSLRGGVSRVRLHYRLAWPVQIIIPADCMAGYQAVFTLLLQIRRASSFLCRHRLLDDGRREDGDHGDDEDGDHHRRKAQRQQQQQQQQPQRRRLPRGDRAVYFTLRAKLLWLCSTLQSYVTTLVIAPHMARLQEELQRAADVDGMIQVHAAFLRALLDEACLGSKLQPIHECLLDLLDLALRLEDGRRAQAAREAEQLQETWRLSVLSSPYQTPAAKRRAAAVGLSPLGAPPVRRRLFATADREAREEAKEAKEAREAKEEEREDDDAKSRDEDGDDVVDDDLDQQQPNDRGRHRTGAQPYGEALRDMRTEFSSYLRFAVNGLRGVTRASSHAAAAGKWGLLADMLEAGMRENQ